MQHKNIDLLTSPNVAAQPWEKLITSFDKRRFSMCVGDSEKSHFWC